MKLIPLTQGQFSMVDDEDFDELNKHKWYAYKNEPHETYYAKRSKKILKSRNSVTILMHREILGLKQGDKRQGDHVNYNGLDNQIHNLRIVTSLENSRHTRGHQKRRKYKYKGVDYVKRTNKKKTIVYHYWVAKIKINGKKYICSKVCKTEIEAALAYNELSKKYFGKFAYINTI